MEVISELLITIQLTEAEADELKDAVRWFGNDLGWELRSKLFTALRREKELSNNFGG